MQDWVNLFLALAIPLLQVLFQTSFRGISVLMYVGFSRIGITETYSHSSKIANLFFVCGREHPTAYFISQCNKRNGGYTPCSVFYLIIDQLCYTDFAWINILGSNGIINKVLVGLGMVPSH